MGALLSWSDKTGIARSLFFDVCTEEQTESESSATEQPVEEGADISDHVRRSPKRVSLEVFVSQTPIYSLNDSGGRQGGVRLEVPKYSPPLAPTPGALFGAIGGAVRGLLGGGAPDYEAQVLQWDQEHDFVAETLDVLEKLRDDYRLVSVVTTSRVFENMHLEIVQTIGNAGTGTGRTLRLSFKELRKVQVRLVNAPVPTETRGHVMKNKGMQGAKLVTGQEAELLRSAAKGFLDRARGRR